MTTIDDYRIVPVRGGGACVMGVIAGRGDWRTTEIRRFHGVDRLVETASGTIYRLGTQHASLWSAQLQMRRPQLHAKLSDAGLA
jgi:hypothetical protein